MAFNKIPVDIFYQFAARRLGKQYIKKFSINSLQEFLLLQTKNTKNCRALLGKRLHSEALQSSRRYYSMKQCTYLYLKGKLEQGIFDKFFILIGHLDLIGWIMIKNIVIVMKNE